MTKKEQVIQDIRDRKLAIENDNWEALIKISNYLGWKDIATFRSTWKYWIQDNASPIYYFDFFDKLEYTGCNISIPATELLKILEGEWMPEVGKEYEFSDYGDRWVKRVFFSKINHEYKYLVDTGLGIIGYKFCRPIQKKQITVSELFEKAGLNEKEWEVVK